MRPDCRDLVESWQRINDAASNMLPASTEAAIKQHVELFDKNDRKDAEERARAILRLVATDPMELRGRANLAAKTLSMNIDSVGIGHAQGVAC